MLSGGPTWSTEPDGALPEGVYRPSAVAAYRAAPRGGARTDFDAERMAPRWRWALMGALLVAAAVAVGLLVRVPVGPAGTLAGANGRDSVIAFPAFSPPVKGSEVVLRFGDRVLTGQVKDSQAGEGGFQVTMLLVELPETAGVDDLEDGARVVLDQGTRPLLLDIWDGSGDR